MTDKQTTPMGIALKETMVDKLGRQQYEIKRLREALKECADDLEAEVEARYSHGIKEHPAMAPKYARDMEPVVKARSLLAEV
jgi:hypothetical protein